MNDGRFKKGHTPWNKGLKGVHFSPDTEFKEGQLVGSSHPSWKGGEYKMKNDCVHVWAGANQRVRRPHLVMGKPPAGYVVYHKDGDKTNDDPSNLEIISRKELLKRNLKGGFK